MNVRENRSGNEEWTIQKQGNYWEHKTQQRQTKQTDTTHKIKQTSKSL